MHFDLAAIPLSLDHIFALKEVGSFDLITTQNIAKSFDTRKLELRHERILRRIH